MQSIDRPIRISSSSCTFHSLLNQGTVPPEHIKRELIECVENGCEKTDLKGTLEIYAKMQAAGLAQT